MKIQNVTISAGFLDKKTMTMCKHCKPQSLSDCCKRLDLPLDAYELVSAKARKFFARKFLVILLSSRLSMESPVKSMLPRQGWRELHNPPAFEKKMNGLGSAEIRRMGVLKSRWILFLWVAVLCNYMSTSSFSKHSGLIPWPNYHLAMTERNFMSQKSIREEVKTTESATCILSAYQ